MNLLLGSDSVLSASAAVDEGPGNQTWVPPVAEVSGALSAGKDVKGLVILSKAFAIAWKDLAAGIGASCCKYHFARGVE